MPFARLVWTTLMVMLRLRLRLKLRLLIYDHSAIIILTVGYTERKVRELK